jgi:hypothetical protein
MIRAAWPQMFYRAKNGGVAAPLIRQTDGKAKPFHRGKAASQHLRSLVVLRFLRPPIGSWVMQLARKLTLAFPPVVES